MRATVAAAFGLSMLSVASAGRAEERPIAAEQIDLAADTRPSGTTTEETEAPPPRPYEKSLVLDSSIGALAFLGQFGQIAPPGPWMHVQLGYELTRWLMVYGEGELAFTDTSRTQVAPKTRVFSIFGFGGGVRFTARFGRVGAYVQPGLGLLGADVPNNALGILGFRDAESLGVWLGARAGVELYQINRHLALGLTSQIRTAQGFTRTGASRDTPLALDAGVALRYAF